MLPPMTYEILGLAVIALIVWLIWDSLRAREAAVAASRLACESEGLQFLDDTVAITTVRPSRDGNGQLRLRRVYTFEYSDTGTRRYPGSVVMHGDEVVTLRLSEHPPRAPLTLY